MVAAHRQQLTIGRVAETRDNRGMNVGRGMFGIHYKLGGRRCVVLGALFNPTPYQVDIVIDERVFALGHGRGLAALRCNLRENQALGELSGHDPRLVAVAGLEQGGMVCHDEAPLIFGGLMAALAVLLKDGPNLAVVADWLRRLLVFRRLLTPKDRAGYKKSRARIKLWFRTSTENKA